ncbi:dnaJ homolog subfamily C member 17 [Polyergus mexicanus]|uniref:dnaJ homolog subfamily C member 17 n=1 Tax=Polyergus mexicanus TaxID=615972 RepID=UPI0038B53EB4
MDLYELLGVEPHATFAEIKKAYRKKSLTCHPDKNPHNRAAVAEFYKLSEAIKLLSDNKARAAYDETIAAKKRVKERNREFDAKRRKLKDDLEAREEAFKRAKSDEERKKMEIEKLRKEGEKLLEEEILIQKQRMRNLCKEFDKKEFNTKSFIIKIRWHTQEDDPSNGGYNYDVLYKMFSKYGDIVALVVSSTKRGTAMVEFEDKSAAETALLTQIGLIKNPLKLRGLWNGPQKHSSANSNIGQLSPAGTHLKNEISKPLSFASTPDIFAQVRYRMSDAEFEVLSNLRKAEERKRLIEELKAEET